jgi:hypothetical protein
MNYLSKNPDVELLYTILTNEKGGEGMMEHEIVQVSGWSEEEVSELLSKGLNLDLIELKEDSDTYIAKQVRDDS